MEKDKIARAAGNQNLQSICQFHLYDMRQERKILQEDVFPAQVAL